MKRYGPESFGALNAEDYDALHDPGTTDAAVACLADLAAGGRVLELAIGTGRVALPLARRGLHVEGIEASTEMVDKLRAKPGGEALPVAIGDMAETRVEGRFDLVFLIFNTLFNLTSQAAQVRCFANAASHLSESGVFVVEAFVPGKDHLDWGGSVRTRHVGFDSAVLEARVHDPVAQRIDYQHIAISNAGVRLTPLPMRYAWPAEIDLMARLAGLELRERWGSWERAPFTSDSKMHVSVYGRKSTRQSVGR